MTDTSDQVPSLPSDQLMDRLVGVLQPLSRVTQPSLLGVENVPDGGSLLVGNHTIYGFLDLPFMMAEIWRRRGIVVRGLGDHRHYAVPVWRNLLEMCGMVRGTRENVRALMRQRQNVLVFPGGAGEVFKGKGMKYRLAWKERLGFAKLAIEFGYPIVPFAAVGAEEMLDVVADAGTPGYSQVSSLMKRLVGVPLPPLARGVGLTPLPRPQRLYFWFGQPIETAQYDREPQQKEARALRNETKAAVELGIARLMEERRHDPKRGALGRLLSDPEASLAEADPEAFFVTKAFEAWNESGPEGAAAWMADGVELVDPPRWPGSDTWVGREAAVARLEEVSRELHASKAEIFEAESFDGRVLVSFSVRSDRDAGVRFDFFALVDLGDEEITRIQVFFDEADALAAFGSATE